MTTLRHKLLDPSFPVIFFEVVPPEADKPEAVEKAVELLKAARTLADAVNIPEIREEERGKARGFKFVPRVDPRKLGAEIRRTLGTEVVVNRVVVHEPDQLAWFRDTCQEYEISTLVLVGGESSQVRYPGPSVLQAAEQITAAALPVSLGAISIPSRLNEAERIRRKSAAGMGFFTTQVLFDSNDIVWLIQRLNGLQARIFLSFAPVSHPRDLQFLRWLGADIPRDLDHFLLGSEDRSLDLAQRILMDVFDNLPPDPPSLGLNVEHINRRNFGAALRMLERLGSLYSTLVTARARVWRI